MKVIVLIITAFLFSHCLFAQEGEEVIITGEHRFQELYDNAKTPWFKQNYIQYNYNPITIQQLHSFANNEIRFDVFGGTWCDDTQNLIPRFYKTIHDAGFQDFNYNLYLLDRNKKSPNGEEDGLNIIKVPTIIVYRNGQEVGRIIEVVTNTIESDLVEILSRH